MIGLLFKQFTSAWWLRLWLGLWLAFGSEIIVWHNLPSRSPAELLGIFLGSMLIAAIMLNLLVRFHIRDVFGLLLLAGIYSLSAGLLLRPEYALADMPFTLVTRVMGAHTLIGFLMCLAFLIMLRGTIRPLEYASTAMLGLGWGIWSRWAPVLVSSQSEPVLLETLLAYAVGFMVLLIIISRLAAARTAIGLSELLLNLRSTAFVTIAVVIIVAARAVQGLLDQTSLIMIPSLIAFCVIMLWFQKREKIRTLLDTALPPRKANSIYILFLSSIFLLAGAAGYAITPFSAQNEQFTIITGIFTAFGVVWLPTVSLVLGARAYMRQIRRQR